MPAITAAPNNKLLAHYCATREHTQLLAQHLSPEDAMMQSMPDASPAKWHLAHTTWFFDIFILEKLAKRQCSETEKILFNSYYQGIGQQHQRAARGLLSSPTLQQVYDYRTRVDTAIKQLLSDAIHAPSRLSAALSISELDELITLGCQHEMQHQELLLTDIQHALFQNPLQSTALAPCEYLSSLQPTPSTTHHNSRFATVKGGLINIGTSALNDPCAFDNEGPIHKVWLEDFSIAQHPVTNGEYLEFCKDAGYETPHFWHDKGWSLCQQNGWKHPLYWHWNEPEKQWYEFQCDGHHPLNLTAPVRHISWFEAAAYCQWSAQRLPTEFELEVAMSAQQQAHWGHIWEWSASAYTPYPNYQSSEGAVGEYNGKFMVDQMVLKGWSRFTPKAQRRSTYRNFFPTDCRWQCAGFRVAQRT